MTKRLRYGMIGGGRGAFIGAVHRIAASLDGQAVLAAGAFSSDPGRSREAGASLGLSPARVYASYQEMLETEARLPSSERIHFVSIVTPNDQHFAPACLALKAGIPVVLDKPATLSLKEALELRKLVRETGVLLALTHNYSAAPMIREARSLVESGELGTIRKVVAEYSQGWLAQPIERQGQKQASWRTDPKRAGSSGCIGDIGVHAAHLACHVTGLSIESLCADLTSFVEGRPLDDDGNILLRFSGGAKGVLHASQISVGDENALTLRVYGTKSSIEWHQETPDRLIQKFADQPRRILTRGNGYTSSASRAGSRLPPGHPEGYLESFANIYREFCGVLEGTLRGKKPKSLPFPTIDDGVAGMAFIEAAVKSSRAGARWVRLRSA